MSVDSYIVKNKVLRQNHFYCSIKIVLAFESHGSFSGNVYN